NRPGTQAKEPRGNLRPLLEILYHGLDVGSMQRAPAKGGVDRASKWRVDERERNPRGNPAGNACISIRRSKRERPLWFDPHDSISATQLDQVGDRRVGSVVEDTHHDARSRRDVDD